MLTTDQAFIRAYRHDSVQENPSDVQSHGTGQDVRFETAVEFVCAAPLDVKTSSCRTDSPARASSSDQSSRQEMSERHLRRDRVYSTAFADCEATSATTRHFPIDGALVEGAAEECHDDVRRVTPTQHVFTSRKRPLSAQLAGAGAESEQGIHPESTVAEFRYPAICQQLLTRYGAEINRIAERLIVCESAAKTLIGFTGNQSLTGCTTVLICVARRLISLGKTVVIADANFQRPALASRLGIHPTATWQDVLTRGYPVAEALVRSAADGLSVLPASNIPLRLGDRSITSQASITAGALRYAYDLTLVDLGAISEPNQVATMITLAKAMRLDASMLIANHGHAGMCQWHHTQHPFARLAVNVLGVVENFWETVPTDKSAA